MEKHKEKVEEFFKHYPEATACILFTDGQIFEMKNENWAKSYSAQSGLQYQTVTKDGEISPEGDEVSDLSVKKVAELKELATSLGIEYTKRATKQELIDAIEALQQAQEEDYKPLNQDENE